MSRGRSYSHDGSRYVGLTTGRRTGSWRRPWERLPGPVKTATLRLWGALPSRVHRALAPLGEVINPGHTTTAEVMPGPSTVPGVEPLRAEGFTPIEELTGFMAVALVWPDQHRRSVPETREQWLDEPLDGKVWLVRPPWASWTLDDTFAFLWSVADDRHEDERARLEAASDALRWPEKRASAQLARVRAQR